MTGWGLCAGVGGLQDEFNTGLGDCFSDFQLFASFVYVHVPLATVVVAHFSLSKPQSGISGGLMKPRRCHISAVLMSFVVDCNCSLLFIITYSYNISVGSCEQRYCSI
jgi:hypothetical protein